MIKTLRITSIIAVILAVVFFVLPAIFGIRGDEQREQFLNSAGVMESFREAKGGKVSRGRQEDSPLVKQAEAFALYLNPPPKPKPPVSRSRPRPKGPVSPKFKLLGTSRYTSQPELSLALIDEPGKGLRWVRQAGKVGHLTIEQVKDGVVVVKDGERTFELVAERQERRSLLKKGSENPLAQMSAEKKAALAEERKKAMAELDAMIAELKADEADFPSQAEEIAAARGRRRNSSPETMRISAGEAKRLKRLGQKLEDVQRTLNRAGDDKIENDADKDAPDSNDVNSSG